MAWAYEHRLSTRLNVPLNTLNKESGTHTTPSFLFPPGLALSNLFLFLSLLFTLFLCSSFHAPLLSLYPPSLFLFFLLHTRSLFLFLISSSSLRLVHHSSLLLTTLSFIPSCYPPPTNTFRNNQSL
ncbi:MAG: hypothetical protein J3R72DRAFT_187834 [Linnemannia gamsii]|nr:MAG: hypothetical protein J3R72DRAFT_187834 [Linnemannia gamsii]